MKMIKLSVCTLLISLINFFPVFAQEWSGSTTPSGLIHRTGGVSVGTSSPQETFYVQGAMNTTAIEWVLGLKNPANSDAGNPYGVGLKLRQGASTEHGKWSGIASISESTWANATGLALFANEIEYLRIRANGQVGIGTTNTFGYRLAVNGVIGAKEVKVETTSAWPDYVFCEGYELPSLSFTKKFISDNGHLPGIPSADEVAEEGIVLGEMNALLLEKIEELTLHLIRKDEEIAEMKAAIAAIQAAMAQK